MMVCWWIRQIEFVCSFPTRRCYVAKKLFFSDELFQAQQAPHHRWASEDVVSVLMMESMESDSSAAGPSQIMVANMNMANHPGAVQRITNGIGTTACRNDFFPVTSPPSTISESSGSVMAGMVDPQRQQQLQQKCVSDVPNNGQVENTGLFGFPEYKHW